MNWYIGQTIVAIKDHSQLFFKSGDIFTINAIRKAPCGCDHIEIDVGSNIPQPYVGHICNRCFKKTLTEKIAWFNERSFAPIDELMAEQIEELKLELSL